MAVSRFQLLAGLARRGQFGAPAASLAPIAPPTLFSRHVPAMMPHRFYSASSAPQSSYSAPSSESHHDDDEPSLLNVFFILLAAGAAVQFTYTVFKKRAALQEADPLYQMYQVASSDLRKSLSFKAFRKQYTEHFFPNPNQVYSDLTVQTKSGQIISSGVFFEGPKRVEFSKTLLRDTGRIQRMESSETTVSEYAPGLTLIEIGEAGAPSALQDSQPEEFPHTFPFQHPEPKDNLTINTSMYENATAALKAKYASPEVLTAALPPGFFISNIRNEGDNYISFSLPSLKVTNTNESKKYEVTYAFVYSPKLKIFRLDDVQVKNL